MSATCSLRCAHAAYEPQEQHRRSAARCCLIIARRSREVRGLRLAAAPSAGGDGRQLRQLERRPVIAKPCLTSCTPRGPWAHCGRGRLVSDPHPLVPAQAALPLPKPAPRSTSSLIACSGSEHSSSTAAPGKLCACPPIMAPHHTLTRAKAPGRSSQLRQLIASSPAACSAAAFRRCCCYRDAEQAQNAACSIGSKTASTASPPLVPATGNPTVHLYSSALTLTRRYLGSNCLAAFRSS